MLFSAMSFAASITASDVDFGEVSIKGKSDVMGSTTLHVSWSGLPEYGQVYAEFRDEPEDGCVFGIDQENLYLGGGYDPFITSYDYELSYYADQAGSYSCKLRLYSYESDWETEVEKIINVELVVTADADVVTTTPFVRVESVSELSVDDVVLFVSESPAAVSGAINGAYLPAVTDGVKIDKTNGTADIPEGVQAFTMKKSGSSWQFDAGDYLLGSSTKSLTQGSGVTKWEISISGGKAEINPVGSEYTMQFNSDRFKLYSAGTGTDVALYKKAGEAQQVESKLELGDIEFGDLEQDEQKEVTVNYTAEYLTDDIIWTIEGEDAGLFDVSDTGDRTSGTVTVTYKGTAQKTGALDAKLAYLTQDAKLDPMEGSKAISINLLPATIKLTKLEFVDAPATIDQGQTIDMSAFVVFTPENAENKSLTWTVDKSYQGTVDANGLLKAYSVTGTITVTATSVRMPDVSASHTLTITKPTITDFTLSDTVLTMHIGEQNTLTITAFVPTYASEKAVFASTNTTVATVGSSTGKVTAKAIGETEITATIGSVVKTCKVTVEALEVESIQLPEEANVVSGMTLQLNPTITPADAASQHTISYTSDNEAVATVSESGLVNAVAKGEAVITATISDKSAQITIHVIEPPVFTKVTDASTLAEGDTIILATIYGGNGVIAGKRDNKNLTVLTENVLVSATEAYADDACRLVLGTVKNKEGFTLTIVGGQTIAVTSTGNDIVDANTQNCKFWEFVADDNKGIYVHNLGNTNAYFKYHAGNAAVKPYKVNTSGAVYVYAYVRKYIAPVLSGVDNTELSIEVRKVIRNGELLILRGGETYTVTGTLVR